MILQANHFLEQVLGPAKLIGTTKDGQARVERNSVYREKDEIFRADDDEAARLIEIGAARSPRLAGELGALAEKTLDSDGPLDATLAAMPLPRLRVWHAVRPGQHWIPAPVSHGCQRRSKIGPRGGAKLGHFGFAREARGGRRPVSRALHVAGG